MNSKEFDENICLRIENVYQSFYFDIISQLSVF